MISSKMIFALVGGVATVYANSIGGSASTGSIKNKRLCRSCGGLEKVVSKRMEETAAKPKVVEVAARIGPDGRPIPGRKIDYLTSESRFMDVITDICDDMEYSSKSGCYLITNEYDEQLRNWFMDKERKESGFLEGFCFKELPDCTRSVYDASLTDIEMENYEEDKDKIDDDFMPEAKEENVKAAEKEANFAKEALEKVMDIRDNLLDEADALNAKIKKHLREKVFESKVLRPHLMKFFKREHLELFLANWYLGLLSVIVSLVFPFIFVIFLKKYHNCNTTPTTVHSPKSSTLKVPRKSSSRTLKSKVPSVLITESSESEAAEADDEKVTTTPSPSKRTSKRNSRSQAD